MRSSELAKLAGVTVRTLRHYHALGLLSEPPRAENGYRSYGASDLARLLRIKRLASLGFSLERIKGMLDEGPAEATDGATDELDALDRELAARIEQLEAQRALIADLRAAGAAGDVAVAYSPFVAEVSRLTDNGRVVSYERDVLALADSLLPGEFNDFIAAYHAEMLGRGSVARYVELNERYMALDENATKAQCDRLVEDFADFLVPVVANTLTRYPNVFDIAYGDRAESIMLAFDEERLNPVQTCVSDRIGELATRRLVEEVRTRPALKHLAVKLLDPDVTS